jgi:hypothetical protein
MKYEPRGRNGYTQHSNRKKNGIIAKGYWAGVEECTK